MYFCFASMIASFYLGFLKKKLRLGIFINFAGIIGCLFLGKFEDNFGSENIVITCIIFNAYNYRTLFY